MATHDYIISNASGAAVRADLNNALAAIASNNSSATEPTTTYAYQWWADTGSSPTVMKLRNAANSAWITLFQLDGEWSLIPFENGSAAAPSIYFKDSGTDTGIYSPGTDSVAITTGGTQRATVDSSGRLLVGTSSTSLNANVVLNGSSSGAGNPANVYLQRNETAPAVDAALGQLFFANDAGNTAASIRSLRDAGTWTTGSSHPGRLTFSTTADGDPSPTERLRITSAGLVGIGTASPGQALDVSGSIAATGSMLAGAGTAAAPGLSFAGDPDGGMFRPAVNTIAFATLGTERMRITNGGETLVGTTTVFSASSSTATGNILHPDGYAVYFASGQQCLYLGRQTSDGSIVSIRQAGVEEGSISVSGTTVSYNGAHLSRWSQLPSGQEREEILRGTVLSNIDEMCEWGEEDNEQLNRMKVSDAEGDKNVSGVFQAWDDDDDTYTNDFYCAMTGDFIIRIAEGVTVERGDLLMSAGDGTAKPQDDDIIRSKTIAKVTSTNVSCTYEDGSYCVPCVLMAC